MALHINGQVPVAEANIRAILAGKSPRKTYKAKTGNPIMAVSLGLDYGHPLPPASRTPLTQPHGHDLF